MPPRKEPKETVVYPASKSKVPAYKPLRPSGVPRIPTTESESSTKAAPARKPAAKKAVSKKAVPKVLDDNGDEDEPDGPPRKPIHISQIEDSDEDLDDIMSFKPASKVTSTKPAPKRRKTTTREPSPTAISSDVERPQPPDLDGDPMPSQSDDTPSIPQPLLIRLLHESFADKNTKIDTEAIQVLQKYVEIFVREAIARTQLEKVEKAERRECSEQDASWFELEDLEAVAPGLVLDF